MVGLMPPKPRSDDKRRVKAKADYPDRVDAFTRIEGETARKLDELAEEEHRTRSSHIAWLIDRHVKEEYPKLLARRRADQAAAEGG
jgi:predicted transcriptional regulator